MNFIDNWSQPITLAVNDESSNLSLPNGMYELTIADSATTATRWEIVFVQVEEGTAWLHRPAPQEWPEGSIIYCSITADLLDYLSSSIEDLLLGFSQLDSMVNAAYYAIHALEQSLPEKFQPIVEVNESRLLTYADAGATLRCGGVDKIELELPSTTDEAWPSGAEISVVQAGPAPVSITPGKRQVALLALQRRTTAGPGARMTLKRVGDNEWVVAGDLAPMPEPPSGAGLVALAASEDGDASAGRLQVFSALDFQPVAAMDDAEGPAEAVSASPDGSLLALACRSPGKVYIYRTIDWGLEAVLDLGQPTSSIHDVAFNRDGTLLAIAKQSTPRLVTYQTSDWSLTTPQPQLRSGSTPRYVRFAPHADMLVTDNWRHPHFSMFDTVTWERTDPDEILPAAPQAFAFSPTGHILAVQVSQKPDIALIQMDAWRLLDTPPGTNDQYNNKGCVEFSPDGTRLLATSGHYSVILSGPDFQTATHFESDTSANRVAWNESGDWVVSATDHYASAATLLHADTQEEIYVDAGSVRSVSVALFSRPDT